MTSQRRLLDMLAGWLDWLDGIIQHGPAEGDTTPVEVYARELDLVIDLYAGAGALSSDEEVVAYFNDHVLPVVFG